MSPSEKACSRCGYVLGPFDEHCPRCARQGITSVSAPPQPAPAAPPPATPAPRPQGTTASEVLARRGVQGTAAPSYAGPRPYTAAGSPQRPAVVVVLAVLIGLGAMIIWGDSHVLKNPLIIFYMGVRFIAAVFIIYGLVTLSSWGRAAAIIYLVANFVIGVPIHAVAIIQASAQVENEAWNNLKNQPNVHVAEPGSPSFTVTTGNPDSSTAMNTAPITPVQPPTATTPPPSGMPTPPPGAQPGGQVTITPPNTPGGLGFFGLLSAAVGLLALGVVSFIRLILDIMFIVFLCQQTVKEAFA